MRNYQMKNNLTLDKDRLNVFHEGTKRRIFVGQLMFNEIKNYYEFNYDKEYTHFKNAIPISPALDLFKVKHISKKGELFPAFIDRIPLKSNPAYKDYCYSQGISPNEENPIILLGTIGRKGPSSFIFESVYKNEFTTNLIKETREALNVSQHDFSQAFDISKNTLQRIESGKSNDMNSIKLIQIYLHFPEVALWQLKQTGQKIHSNALNKLFKYFEINKTSK